MVQARLLRAACTPGVVVHRGTSHGAAAVPAMNINSNRTWLVCPNAANGSAARVWSETSPRPAKSNASASARTVGTPSAASAMPTRLSEGP